MPLPESTPDAAGDAQRIHSLFRGALALRGEAEQDRFLEDACAGSPALLAHLRNLLEANRSLAGALSTLHTDARIQASPESPPPTSALLASAMAAEAVAGPAPGEPAPVSTPAPPVRPLPDAPRSPPPPESLLPYLEPCPDPGAIGRIGHYRVLGVIGQGGFATVLKAVDETLDRTVAIKLLAPEMAASPTARKRFLREAKASAAIRHDHVVAVHAVGEKPLPHLVMDYIPGVSLQQLIDAAGPLSPREILWIGGQVARGLAAAHDKGLIHRDIKPGNILLETGPESRARLTDFGLARSTDEEGLTVSGNVAGTPAYMSPEQARGEEVDARGDLFSLGGVLYAMATGRHPFMASSIPAVLRKVNDEEPRPIRELAPQTPEWLCAIIARLQSKKPSDRPESALAVAEWLGDHLARLRPDGTLSESLATGLPPAVPSRFARAAPPLRPTARSRLVWAAAALLAALPLGWAGWKALRPAGTVPPPGPAPQGAAPTPAPPPDRHRNALGMVLARVPAGTINLQGRSDGSDPGTPHTVERDFYLDTHEVTQALWTRVMGNAPSPYRRDGKNASDVRELPDEEIDALPVTEVSHDQCQEFVGKLNAMLHEPGWLYRLPSLQEWEFACRGGGAAPREEWCFDFYLDKPLRELPPGLANCGGQHNRPLRVGSFPPNRLGLHDMHGNVFEHCLDIGQDKNGRTVGKFKDGTWFDEASYCHARMIGAGDATARYRGSGLRVIRVATDPTVK